MPKHTHTQIEQWRDIPGNPGYQVSDHGRVRSLDRVVTYSSGQVHHYKGRVLRTPLNRQTGYPFVGLHNQGQRQHRYVHSLVAETFIGPRPEGMEVCHSDGDPANNRVGNLRYGTRSDNELDKVRHGTNPHAAKTHCPRDHELFAENIPPSEAKRGKRKCLACNRAHSRVHYRPELKPQFKAIADSYYQAILEERKATA
jgi:hypothetical protein